MKKMKLIAVATLTLIAGVALVLGNGRTEKKVSADTETKTEAVIAETEGEKTNSTITAALEILTLEELNDPNGGWAEFDDSTHVLVDPIFGGFHAGTGTCIAYGENLPKEGVVIDPSNDPDATTLGAIKQAFLDQKK
ncbi:MAG: hypothetical protein LBM95_08950 [Lactobacillales bacterium]|jgi:hypothetical protein|nr:hypothetical protein [Lactobacillales bacterium]